MLKKLYQVKVKERTERTILLTCAVSKQFTAVELSKKLKISLPTINFHLEEFQKKGYIKEIGTIGSDLGRKSRLWLCLLLQRSSIAMEIDSKHIRMALFTLDGEISHQYTWQHRLSALDFNSTLQQIIEEYLNKLPQEKKKEIQSLGISIPGDVSFDRKNIIFATNLSLKNIDISPLEQATGLNIFIENEANAAALGEVFLDQNLKNDNSLFISVSEKGVGGGLIIEGKLQKGMRRKGGEIGHMSIDINGKQCSCGNKGCLERYTSQEALEEEAQKAGFNLEQLFSSQSNEAQEIIKNYCHYLGRGIRNLLSIFDPSKIYLGGPICLYWERLYPLLYQEIFINNLFYSDLYETLITASKNKGTASLYGAAILPFIDLFYDKDKFN